MNTITAVLKADADGTLHVPLPRGLQSGQIKIVATLEAVDLEAEAASKAARKQRAMAALERLRERGTFRGVDAVAWQREIRQDRPLPGREE